MSLRFYHGTSAAGLSAVTAGIRVALGGGELGQGFYTTDQLYVAKAWAYNKHGGSDVIEVAVPEASFFQLQIVPLTPSQAGVLRRRIRAAGETRTYRAGCDVMWARIVGGGHGWSDDQYKWESNHSEALLNGYLCARRAV